MGIRLKRAYEPAAAEDGYRVLVERLWPRGLSKDRARVDRWIKEAGASTELRRWFGHDPARWEEFRRRYADEVRARPGVREELRGVLREHATVTFLFAAHDEEHNNAVALKELLERDA